MSKKDNPDSFSSFIKEEITDNLPKDDFKVQATLAGVTYCRDEDSILLGDPTEPEFRRYFLRGVFLECGYFTDPRKSYRIELRVKNPAAAEIIGQILEGEGIDFTLSERSGLSVIYIRNGDSVADFLGMIGAGKSRLTFESIRAEKEVYVNVNRAMNCDTANAGRQAEAGVRRNEAFLKLKASEEYRSLPKELKDALEVHLENPGLSIADLGKLMDPPIGKSGMNHRLNRLLEIAKGLD
ncbi:MAG: DNA-binding protein WhiA [Clostridiales bacterium]|nr:DNA-binding protein WhiA [Clostridiales bacterium]